MDDGLSDLMRIGKSHHTSGFIPCPQRRGRAKPSSFDLFGSQPPLFRVVESAGSQITSGDTLL